MKRASARPFAGPLAESGRTNLELRQRLSGLLTANQPSAEVIERRQAVRYPYPHLLTLTPVAADGISPCGAAIVVAGKQISDHGLGFFHPHPLPHRRMIATLELSDQRTLDLLIDITWCRFTRYGWYEGGGRFLQAAAQERGNCKLGN